MIRVRGLGVDNPTFQTSLANNPSETTRRRSQRLSDNYSPCFLGFFDC